MGKPISQIKEDYEDFDKYVINLVRVNWKDIWTSDFELEQRFSNLEHGIQQVLTTVHNLDGNLRLYREDSRIFRTEIKMEQARTPNRSPNFSLAGHSSKLAFGSTK